MASSKNPRNISNISFQLSTLVSSSALLSVWCSRLLTDFCYKTEQISAIHLFKDLRKKEDIPEVNTFSQW